MRVVEEDRLAAALGGLGPAPRVVVGGNFATPERLVDLLDRAVPTLRLFVLNPQCELPERPGVVVETPFVGPGLRHRGDVDYLPMRLSLAPRCFDAERPPDAVVVQAAPPRDGRISLGIEVNVLPSAIEAVRRRGGLVIAQLNSHMPYTHGDAERSVDDVDLAVECDEPLRTCVAPPSDAATDELAANVARYAEDGATLQCGIGKIPDAVCARLRGRRRLGVWSEMVSDGLLALEREGALDAGRPLVASFLGGTEDLYRWAHLQPRLELRRTEVVNDPSRIAAQPRMLSINAALQVDLTDQANASCVGARVHSGFGGQPDFVSGALHAPGGRAIIALRAWHAPSGASTIVGRLETAATSFQHSVVVTEHGAAELFGESRAEQARRLIEHAAAPDARPALLEDAAALGLLAPR